LSCCFLSESEFLLKDYYFKNLLAGIRREVDTRCLMIKGVDFFKSMISRNVKSNRESLHFWLAFIYDAWKTSEKGSRCIILLLGFYPNISSTANFPTKAFLFREVLQYIFAPSVIRFVCCEIPLNLYVMLLIPRKLFIFPFGGGKTVRRRIVFPYTSLGKSGGKI
jgi:hypothetical protein